MSIPKLLIVDDDAEMRQMMASFMQNSGFIVYQGATLADLKQHLNDKHIDLLLLDVMLEYESGIDICQTIREEHNLPIIMVSALSSDRDRMSGYSVGADDYIAKPFNKQLLLARVNAVLRRVQRSSSLQYRRDTASYEFAGWTYESQTDEVLNPNGVLVALSQRELKLLQVLLANPHIALSRDEITDALERNGSDKRASGQGGKALDVLVGRIRNKIEADPKNPKLILTVRNVGYKLATAVTKKTMFKNIEIRLKTLINVWIMTALLAGVVSTYMWMDSNKRWQLHLQKRFTVGISIHDYLHGHDVLPADIITSQLSPNESRLADAGLWQKLAMVGASDKISNYVLDDIDRNDISYKTIRVTILSKKISYEKDEVSLNERIPNSQKLAEITRLLTRYCSQNTLLIKFDNDLWRTMNGNAIWGCAAQPTDYRLAAMIFLAITIGSLITMASITTSKFTYFSEKLKNRFRKKDAFLFEVKGTKELRDLAKALNINIEKERASLAKRSLFLSGVSHDLGTPATRLLLRSEQIDDIELREKFETDIVKMTDMIQSVLSYTQSEIVDDIHRPLSLVALVRTVVDDFADMDKPVSFTEPTISTTTVHNIFQGKDNKKKSHNILPLDNFVVKGDSVALQRAITNLIDNALKYGRRAIVSISGNETYAEVSVLDNGQDVSVQDLETLTQPFQRGFNASHTLGSGIGLAVVHNIAEQHGGNLTFARTEAGMTATMTILRT